MAWKPAFRRSSAQWRSVDRSHGPRADGATGSGQAAVQLGRERDGCHRGQSLRQVERSEHCRDARRLGTLQRPGVSAIRHPFAVCLVVHRPLCKGPLGCRRQIRSECRIEAVRRRGHAQGPDRNRPGVAGRSEMGDCGRAGRYILSLLSRRKAAEVARVIPVRTKLVSAPRPTSNEAILCELFSTELAYEGNRGLC